ncbi:MAG TPA: histidine kinase dimerization/phospho-acceptor domain-containing protein [Gaiellaceae bacterium]
MNQDTSFPRLVSLACHDLRTPLATVHGFARTLSRRTELAPPADRYMEMIEAAAGQLAELLDELSLVARIESGRYDPNLREADTLELARAAAEQLGEDRVRVDGTGAQVRVDLEATERGIAALVQAALRHGGLEQVDVHVEGPQLRVGPITASSGAVVLGTDLRDLGAAVAVRLIERLGGELSLDGDELRVRLPA